MALTMPMKTWEKGGSGNASTASSATNSFVISKNNPLYEASLRLEKKQAEENEKQAEEEKRKKYEADKEKAKYYSDNIDSFVKTYNDISAHTGNFFDEWKNQNESSYTQGLYTSLNDHYTKLRDSVLDNSYLKDVLSEDEYIRLERDVNAIGKSIEDTMAGIKSASDVYANYNSADDYDKHVRLSGMYAEKQTKAEEEANNALPEFDRLAFENSLLSTQSDTVKTPARKPSDPISPLMQNVMGGVEPPIEIPNAHDDRDKLMNAQAAFGKYVEEKEQEGKTIPSVKEEDKPKATFGENALGFAQTASTNLALGAANSISSIVNGLEQAIGDAASGGAYSDGFKVLSDYFGAMPSELRTEVLAELGTEGHPNRPTRIGSVSRATGVSQNVIEQYAKSVQNENMRESVLNSGYAEKMNPALKEHTADIAFSIGQQIPGLMLSGALSGATSATSAIGSAIGANPSTVLIGMSVAGNEAFNLAREKGYNPSIYAEAVMQGGIEMILEGLLGFSDVSSYQKLMTNTGSTVGNVAKSFIKYIVSGAEEGLEEVINVPLSNLTSMMFGEDKKVGFGEGDVFDYKEMIKSGMSGAAVGLIMGGVMGTSMAVSAVKEGADIRYNADWLNKMAQKLPEHYRPATVNAAKATEKDIENYGKELTSAFNKYMTDSMNGKAVLSNKDKYGEDVASVTEDNSTVQLADQAEVLAHVQAEDTEGAKEIIEQKIQHYNEMAEALADDESLKEIGGEGTSEKIASNVARLTETKDMLDAGTYNADEAQKVISAQMQKKIAEGKKTTAAARQFAETVKSNLGVVQGERAIAHTVELLEADVKNGVNGASVQLKVAKKALDSIRKEPSASVRSLLGNTEKELGAAISDSSKKRSVQFDYSMPEGSYASYNRGTGTVKINPMSVLMAQSQMDNGNKARSEFVHEAGHIAAQMDASFVSKVYDVYTKLRADKVIPENGLGGLNETDIREAYRKDKSLSNYLNTATVKNGIKQLVAQGATVEQARESFAEAFLQEEIAMHFLSWAENNGANLYNTIVPEKRNAFVEAMRKIAQFFRDVAAKIRGKDPASAKKMDTLADKLYNAVRDFAGGSTTAQESVNAKTTENTTATESGVPEGSTGTQEADERKSLDVRATLNKIFEEAEVVDGIAVSPEVAEVMKSDEYSKPDDYMEFYSVSTTDAWKKNYLAKNNGEDAQSVADAIVRFTEKMVQNDAIRGYVPMGDYKTNKMGPLRTNQEYIWTFDMDTSCPRTFQFLNFRDAIQKRAGRYLTYNESINLLELMRAYGQQIPCCYCYVENKRVLLSASYNNFFNFRNAVLNAKTDEEAEKAMYGYDAKKGLPEASRKALARWREDPSYNPSVTDIWTATNTARNSVLNYLDGEKANGNISVKTAESKLNNMVLEKFGITDKGAIVEVQGFVKDWAYDTLANIPHVYNTDNNTSVSEVDERALALNHEALAYSKSASSAKSVENYIPYTDQLKNVSAEDKAYIIGMGGIRKHSSNDFRMDYVQDYFLFYADLAAGKWTGHTYSKSADFVKIFACTGDRINMSVAFYEDADGKLRENTDEGAYWRDVKELREAYDNVGSMAMVTSDNQLSYALNADWIDMIIPFHASGLDKSVWYNLRMWNDYTTKQSERFYNADTMKQKLAEAGVEIPKGANAAQIKSLFENEFNIKHIYGEKGEVLKPHFFPGDTYVNGQLVPGHHNDVKTYFRLCEEYGVHPRFYGIEVKDARGKSIEITEHPSYLKLIKETSRTDTPQETIKFNFGNYDDYLKMTPFEYAMQRLEEEAKNGGFENTKADPYGVVKEFTEEYLGKNRPLGYLTERAKETRDILLEMSHESEEKQNATVEDAVDDERKSIATSIYIKDGHTSDGETVDFINLILDGKKKGETRTHKSLTRKWVGIAKDGYVYGRVRFGEPYLIDKDSPEYADSYIEGTEYDIADGEQKYYYPILEVEDFRDAPKPITKHGNYAQYEYEDGVDNRKFVNADSDYFSYRNLTGKSEVKITTIVEPLELKNKYDFSRADVVALAMKSVKAKNNTDDKNHNFVRNNDTGNDILVNRDSIEHGLYRNFKKTALAYANIGDIIENAILINRHDARDGGTEGNIYLGIGTFGQEIYLCRIVTNEYNAVDALEVMYALNTKKESVAHYRLGITGNPLSNTDSSISIADFMDIVKTKFADVLPKDVLDTLGINRPKSELAESMRYSLDTSYMSAVKRGDMDEVQRMVDEAAKKAGYTVKAYHGSDKFGFTKFSTSRSDDGISLFFSSSPAVAKSYTASNDVKAVGKPWIDTAETKKIAEQTIRQINDGDVYFDGDVYKSGGKYIIESYGEDGGRYICSTASEFLEKVDSLKNHKAVGGVYNSYLNLGNSLVVDASGHNWDDIDFVPPEIEENLKAQKENQRNMTERLKELKKRSTERGITMSEAMDNDREYNRLFDESVRLEGEYNNFMESNKLGGDIRTRDIARYAKNRGYNSVTIQNVKDVGGYGLPMELEDTGNPMEFKDTSDPVSTVYILFDSNQVKSADPVTYDGNGNVIPLSERFNPENDDIRYSKETTDKRIARLKEDKEFLKQQMEKSRSVALSPADVDKIVKEMRDQFGFDNSERDNVKKMLELIDKVVNKKIKPERMDEVWDSLARGARSILEGVYEVDASLMKENEAFIKHIRSTPLSVPEENENDFAGGYAEYRNENRKYVNLSRNGTPVETVYAAICEQYPGILDNTVTNPAYMIDEIVRAMKSFEPEDVPSYADTIDQASQEFVNVLGAKYMNTAQKTYAQQMRDKADEIRKDKFDRRVAAEVNRVQSAADRTEKAYKREIERIGKANDKRLQQTVTAYEARLNSIENAAARDAEEYERIINRYKNMEEAREFAGDRKEYARRIRQDARALRSAAVSPNSKKFVPEKYRGNVERIAEFLDYVSTGRVNLNSDIAEPWAGIARIREDFRVVSEMFGEDFSGLAMGILQQMEFYTSGLSQMENKDLKAAVFYRDAYKLGRLMRKSIADMNKVYLVGRAVAANKVGTEIKDTLDARKGKQEEFTSLADKQKGAGFKKLVNTVYNKNLSFTDGYSFFHRMGKVGDEIFETLQGAQSRQVLYMKSYTDTINEKLKDVDLSKYAGAKQKVIRVTLENGMEYSMTAAQAMSVVTLYERENGKSHIEKGGIQIYNPKTHQLSKATALTEKDVASIRNALDEEDNKVMKVFSDFMRDECTAWGNEATMEKYGFHRFTTANYFPINVNRDATGADMKTYAPDQFNVENVGFAKSAKDDGSAPVIIGSMIDVANAHVNGMATYAAYLNVEDGINRVLKVDGVKDTMRRTLGSDAEKYIVEMMNDLKGARKDSKLADNTVDFLNKMAGRYKAAAVSYNASTVAKQPLSYLRAASVIDGKYLAKGAVGDKSKAFEQMMKYSGIAVRKEIGYSDVGVGKTVGDQIGYTDKGTWGHATSVFNEFGMKGAAMADRITWESLWIACRAEQAEKNASAAIDENALMEATAKRFGEVVARTQVVDSALTSAPVSRSNNPLARLTYAFTSEPIKGYNLFVSALDDLVNSPDKNAKSRAAKHLSKVVAFTMVGWAAEAAITSAFSAIRDDDDEIADKFSETYFTNLRDNAIGAIPQISPLADILFEVFAGYTPSNMADQTLTDVVSTMVDAYKTYIDPEGKRETKWKALRDAVESLSTMLGVPVKNIVRIVNNTVKSAFHITNAYKASYELQKVWYNPNNATARDKNGFNSILADAYLSGDKEAFEYIYEDMRKMGLKPQQLVNSIAKDAYAGDIADSDKSTLVKYTPGSDAWYIGMKTIFVRDEKAPKATEDEITRVYKATGETSVLPKFKSGEYTVDGVSKEFTGDALDKYLDDYGRLYYEVANAMRDLAAYRKGSAEEQAWWLTKAEKYASAVAVYTQDKDYSVISVGKWVSDYVSKKPYEVAKYIVGNLEKK